MRQKPENEAAFDQAAYSVLLNCLTGALTVFTIYYGRSLVRATLWPGLGWYRWVVALGEVTFVAMLVWLWVRLVKSFTRMRGKPLASATGMDSATPF